MLQKYAVIYQTQKNPLCKGGRQNFVCTGFNLSETNQSYEIIHPLLIITYFLASIIYNSVVAAPQLRQCKLTLVS